MTVSLTAVTSADVPDLLTSVAALFAEDAGSRDPHTDLGWPAREGAAYYGALLADPDCLCLLVRAASGAPAGHLVGVVRRPHSLRPGVVTAVLESMRVAPGSRRGGAGSALVARFFAWAAEKDATETVVKAYAANEAALAFYRAQGFEPFEVVLRRPA